MFIPLIHHPSDLQALAHKVYFDGQNKLIVVNDGVTELDVKVDIYSSWKEWLLLETRKYNRWDAAIRAIGGDPTVSGQFAGDIYFMINGWRLKRDPSVGLIGALFSDDFDTPSIDLFGNPISLSVVSSLVTSVKTNLQELVDAGIPTASQTANAVWDELLSTHTLVGTTGESQGLVIPSTSSIASAVWEEDLSTHVTSGTAGAALGVDRVTSDNIADAVLGELIADHSGTPGSLAESITIIKGLVQSNFVLDSTTYVNNFLTSARMRIFSNGADVTAATDGGTGQGALATFEVSAEPESPGSVDAKIYKVKQV